MINIDLDLERQVAAYEAGGAAAISILTEPAHFGGSNDDLSRARAAVRIPLLKKDFHVDTVQLFEARALGASAALVIARAVPPSRLEELLSAGNDAGIEILVEVRDERELDLALALGARLIGVNNRNLETLEIDPDDLAADPPAHSRQCRRDRRERCDGPSRTLSGSRAPEPTRCWSAPSCRRRTIRKRRCVH